MAPTDPTPGSRCSIAAGDRNPLVTEWSATEKANLEVALKEGAVAVEYSGCEMKVVSDCRLGRSYALLPVTKSVDTRRVRSAEELYATLPLGAVSLEGELGHSDSLALTTTVAGQYRLEDEGPVTRPSGEACREATHFITSMTVGAFALTAERTRGAGAGVGRDEIRAGAASDRGERLVRAAGDPEACGDESRSTCRSPIQVFLAPFRDPAGSVSRSERSVDPNRAMWVHFEPPDDDTWRLKNNRNETECTLPCTKQVESSSGLVLFRESVDADDVVQIPLPSDLRFAPGAHVKAMPLPARGNVNVGGAMAAVGVGIGLGIPSAMGRECGDGSKAACGVGIGGLAVGGTLFVAGIVYLLAYWRGQDTVQLERQSGAEINFEPRTMSLRF